MQDNASDRCVLYTAIKVDMPSISVERIDSYGDHGEPMMARLTGVRLPVGITLLGLVLFLFSGSNTIVSMLTHQAPAKPLTPTSIVEEGVEANRLEAGQATNLAWCLIVVFWWHLKAIRF